MGNFSMEWFSLKGKVAIITGANQGLGVAYAEAFAKAGADIFIPHLTDDISEVKELVEAQGRKVHFLQGDLLDEAYRKQLIKECLDVFGKIDILVNNAGIGILGDFWSYPNTAWAKCIELDLSVVYYLSREVAVVMKEQGGGKIINIGSALSYTADKNSPPYTAAKHGVLGVSRMLCNELGQYNIQVNTLCPGFLATEVNRGIRESNPDFETHITKRTPAGRWGVPDDLMGTIVFLASPASDYLSGVDINVDGGFFTTL